MGFFKRIGRKVRNVGQRAVHLASIGARKIANSASAIQPLLAKGGAILGTVGAITGQPELVALGGVAKAASIEAAAVSKFAGAGHAAIEKGRHRDGKAGFDDLMKVGQDAKSHFSGV